MPAVRLTLLRPQNPIAMIGLVLSLGCRKDLSEAAGKSESTPPTTAAATDTATQTAITPCGLAQSTHCKGELPDNWKTIAGESLSVKIDEWQRGLGFGRPQMRRARGTTRYSAFTLVFPLDDAHTIRPDKIGGPTVFAVLIPVGPDKEHKWGLDPAGSSRYMAVLDPSNDPDHATWRLERVYWEGGRWQHAAVSGTGKWRTCPEKHTRKDFAYADFLRCGQQPLLPPDLLSFGLSTKSSKSVSALSSLPTAFNSLTRNGEEPIWIFCPEGCCEADWSD
jgi:hypothetical protein